MPVQERARTTVAALLEAAVEIIDIEGWDRASTNRIAARAGVSIGSLYQYFPNKDAILAALVETHRHEVHEAAGAALDRLADPATPFGDAVRELFSSLLDLHRADPSLTRVLTVAVPHHPAPGCADDDEELTRALGEILATRHDVTVRDPLASAHVLAVAIEALSIWLNYRVPPGFDPERLLDDVVDLISRYALAPRGGDPLRTGRHSP
jgi:AcrR family transcriptional regulator